MSPITITPDRLKHGLGVARRCEELALSLFHWSEMTAREMFLLGYIHDIGYEWVDDQRDHERVGGFLTQSVGLAYSDAIRDHGNPDIGVMDDVLLLLNIADMTTSPTGEPVTLVKRLDSIKERYGLDSEQYLRALDMAQRLISELNEKGLGTRMLQ